MLIATQQLATPFIHRLHTSSADPTEAISILLSEAQHMETVLK